MTDQSPLPESPKWGSTTKLVVALTTAGLIVALLFFFRELIAPLLLAVILAFLFHPLAVHFSKLTKLSWKASVNLIYLLLIIILVASFTISGIAILQQTQSVVDIVGGFITNLPEMVAGFSAQTYQIGPFQFDLSQFDLTALAQQVLNLVRPVLGQAGTLISKIAASAATTFGWGLFILLVSYFLLSEGGQLRENLVFIDIPGYNADARRLTRELANTWDTFLRGQMLISLMVVLAYFLLLTILGTRFTIAIALMAGLARFVPYIGPFVTWTVTAMVAFLQGSNHFGLEPLHYAILVVVACLLLDQVFDYMVVPRIFSQSLGVHPAGVLIAAIVAAKLIGLIGVVLAAPVLATLKLLGGYVGRKMLDLNPWTEPEKPPQRREPIGTRLIHRLCAWWRFMRRK